MYIYYNSNPSQRFKEDCVVRAITKLENKSWDDVYIDLCFQGFLEKEMPGINRVWNKYMIYLGYNRVIIPNTCPNCYTVK